MNFCIGYITPEITLCSNELDPKDMTTYHRDLCYPIYIWIVPVTDLKKHVLFDSIIEAGFHMRK